MLLPGRNRISGTFDPRGQCYLVTGASSGIGLAVVRILAAKGCRVTASGRRPSRELPVDFPDVDYVTLDAKDRTGVAELMSRVAPCLDRAVLCAGAGFYRFVEAETSADIHRVVDVNLSSQIRLAHRLYIPLARNGGRLCFIGSAAYKGSPAMPVYAATKAALDGLGRSLALEWQGRIVVKVLHPGPTATGMAERAGRKRDWLSRVMLPPSAMAEMIVRSIEDGGSFRQTLSYSRYLMNALRKVRS
ncbi:SDR family NAD(P)-dependent oxidoreductase [Mesorhizobium sp. YIM 152430]|uniref:SDR family NAD(P)-dependent oxidoreductase n=1 Tax=Mesorhizobium sp. YIM 152430 TaxID=3031761 RepID=UPI0023DAF659|nr:SDR family oxidoreductase [Mesorhizobium sp. YIM 152430]MDF1600246.1 SDR family NAD(P)-dependent oxidoreductase [Mesorhizobium sp. YIM 152430]